MIDNCLICNNKKATKTNSHIIPSFLVAMVSSYDGSYRRGKELMFTISSFQEKIYTGALPDTKLEQIFDTENLTEERIENELSKNTVAKDYIFCPNCEINLSRYLETPYAANLLRNEQINYDIPIFFWISVIWRMSIYGDYGFKLPKDIEDKLHSYIKNYFKLKEEGKDLAPLLKDINFRYKILHCKNFCKDNAGYIYCKYNEHDSVLTMSIGDFCVCGMFENDSLTDDYTFFGLEPFIKKAPINKGYSNEEKYSISPDVYKESIQNFVNLGARLRLKDEFQILDKMWILSGRIGFMPIRMKILFLQMLYDENIKLGERHIPQRYIYIFEYLIRNVILWY
nr:hypothetical protein [Alistipes onderdonkii]